MMPVIVYLVISKGHSERGFSGFETLLENWIKCSFNQDATSSAVGNSQTKSNKSAA